MVGPEYAAQVAGKLNNELSILYSKVNAEPAFKPPHGMTDGGTVSQQQQTTVQSGSGQGVGGNMMGGIESQQRSGRAVSLPPNPQLIHREGEGVGAPGSTLDGEYEVQKEEKSVPIPNHNERTIIKVESLMSPPAPAENKRSLGDGIPQYQPFWYFSFSHVRYLMVVVNVQLNKASLLHMQSQLRVVISINIQRECVGSITVEQYNGHWGVMCIVVY
jgi:hypothetical protein